MQLVGTMDRGLVGPGVLATGVSQAQSGEEDLAKPWLARLSDFFELYLTRELIQRLTTLQCIFSQPKNYLAYEGLSSAFISPLAVVQLPLCYFFTQL